MVPPFSTDGLRGTAERRASSDGPWRKIIPRVCLILRTFMGLSYVRAGRQTLRERRERGERPTDGPAEAASMRNMARLRCTPSLLDPACVHGLGLRAVER